MDWLLTDKEIGEVDVGCGLSEINGSEPYYPLKYEHNLNKAQAKKIMENILSGIAVELDAGQSLEEFYNNIHQKYHKWQALKKDLGF